MWCCRQILFNTGVMVFVSNYVLAGQTDTAVRVAGQTDTAVRGTHNSSVSTCESK